MWACTIMLMVSSQGKPKFESNLQRRFILRVLIPPFLVLLIPVIVGFWQLDSLLRRQAIDELKRAAATTAARLDREFALRETVLKRTGEELFVAKSEYQANRKLLDDSREACRAHIMQKFTYRDAPGGVCDPFLDALARGAPSLQTIENEYVSLGTELTADQNERINEHLSAFKQFFPETLGLMVIDSDKQVVSSALSDVFKGSTDIFAAQAAEALTEPVQGKLLTSDGLELGIFAYPIAGGSVLAAYDLNNANFIRQSWESAPIDRSRMLAVILDSNGRPAYPDLKNESSFRDKNVLLRSEPYIDMTLQDVRYMAVGAPVGTSKWQVAVTSPRAIVLAPLRNAQLAALAVVGLLLSGFLWVGTFFTQRIVRNIISLVGGALVFGAGRLDHKITLPNPDEELLRLADTMNMMAERIATAEQAIDQKNKEFISVATHELKAPMTAIIGNLSMFKDDYQDKTDPMGNKLIDEAYYGTVRLRDLVNDMLNIARLESGQTEVDLVPMPIKKIVGEVVDTMKVVAKIANVKLTYDDKHAAQVVADETRLRIIINNFVSNAIKYNRPGGNVRISHRHKGKYLVTAIADDGLGIPEDQKARMFERFFRVKHDDRKSVTGTGLGMYITNQYVHGMHGEIWFESTHGEGTTFYFSLPIAREKDKQAKSGEVKPNPEAGPDALAAKTS